MKSILKNVVTVSVPTVLLASTAPAPADEIQSVAAQAIAQAANTPAQPATPPAPPPIIIHKIAGERL